MADVTITPSSTGLDAIERRFLFGAWPQAFAHPSWFERLDARIDMATSRECSRAANGAQRAVAEALLMQVGTSLHRRDLAVDEWPLWAMRKHESMQHHLSIAGALNLLPELMRAVAGDTARQWDAVLGHGVRRAALLLSGTARAAQAVQASAPLRQHALRSARSPVDWQRFCLALGLTVLAEHGGAMQARIRLAWPQTLNDVEPLPVDAAVRAWLEACVNKAARRVAVSPLDEVSP